MQKNLNYFKINYMIATMGILSAFILYHPSSLLILSAISAAWAYVFMICQEPLKIGEREVSSREKMLGMTGLSALIIFFLSSAGTYIFSGMGVALLGIGAHSAARVPDDLFIDDAVRVERVLFVYDAAEAWATFWHDLSKIYACARVTE